MPISFSSGKSQAMPSSVIGRPTQRVRMLLRVDHRLADLQLIRDVEFHALGIEWVILRMIGRQIEPVRIAMRADEAVIPDRALKRPHARHALERVDACETGETVRVARDRVATMTRKAGDSSPAGRATGFWRDQERSLDPGGIHALDHRSSSSPPISAFVGLHLADENPCLPAGPMDKRLAVPRC